MTIINAVHIFIFCGFIIPAIASAEQTSSAERHAFLEKYSSVASAIGVAYFCENTENIESLKALAVSSAVDDNLNRGKQMYDAVRELMESIFTYASGVETGLKTSHIVGESKDTVCREGAEAAARMIPPRKP